MTDQTTHDEAQGFNSFVSEDLKAFLSEQAEQDAAMQESVNQNLREQEELDAAYAREAEEFLGQETEVDLTGVTDLT